MDVERTAIGPMLLVAVDQFESPPLVRDPWAARILPPSWRVPLALCRFGAVRRMLRAVSDKSAPGAWTSLLCRKRYIDDLLREAAGNGLDAVVIVGAGLDTRAYRVDELAGAAIWEVDLPANIEAKSAALRRCFGRIPPTVTLLAMDLDTDDLAEWLANSGFDANMRTFFVLESVTMYLREVAVRRTLQSMAACAVRSRLGFTYFRKDFVDGQCLYGARDSYQRFVVRKGLWKFGIDPRGVADLLVETGWRETEQGEDHRGRPGSREPAPAASVWCGFDRGVLGDRGPSAGHRDADAQRGGDDGRPADA